MKFHQLLDADRAELGTKQNQAERRAFIRDWIDRNQKRLAATLGLGALALPALAHAQAAGGLVSLSDI